MQRPSGWFLSSEPSVESEHLALHFEWLIAQFNVGTATALEALRQQEWSTRVQVSSNTTSGLTSFRLSPTTMDAFAKLGLPLDFMLFANDPDEA